MKRCSIKRCCKKFAEFTEKYLFQSLFFSKVAGQKPERVRSGDVLNNFSNFAEKHVCWRLFNKVQVLGASTLLKKTPTQVLSLETSKTFKNNYLQEHLWMTSSRLYLERNSNAGFFLWIWELFKTTYFAEHLQLAGSGTLMQGSLFDKVSGLTVWRPSTVLETDSSSGISLWIFWNFHESCFAEHFLTTTSYMIFFFLFVDQWNLQPKISLFVEIW